MNIKVLKEGVKLMMADPKWYRLAKRIKEHNNNTFYIIGGPVHGNLGDHAIMEEEKLFVKEYFPEYECEEILMPFFNTHKGFLRKYVNRGDIVCVSGGGWMGDLWFHNEVTIREIISMFPDNQIVIFPQTVYYTNNENGHKVLLDTIGYFATHNNLLLCIRDPNSLEKVKNCFVFSGVSSYYYCPDMVLFGAEKKPKAEVEKIVNVCIRNDCEGLYQNAGERIRKIIPDMYSLCNVDTVVPHRVQLRKRKQELNDSWEKFARASLTITDRLHAMLFSYINGTPCIALDNKTGKVFGVSTWIEDKGMVLCAESYEEISNNIHMMLTKEHIGYDPMELRGKFSVLAEKIRKGMI